MCCEDWVRRKFTWMSCIKKTSKVSRCILFPEDGIRSVDFFEAQGRGIELLMQRSLFAQDNYRHMNDSSDTWLTIGESFSTCEFSFKKDKVVSITGLVKWKQETPDSPHIGRVSEYIQGQPSSSDI